MSSIGLTGVMKKLLLLILLTMSALSLSSCMIKQSPKNVYIDDAYNLRVIEYYKNPDYLAVDEYYYTGDEYSGNIEINVVIPKEINGIPVGDVGRRHTYKICSEPIFYHDKSCAPTKTIFFAIVCQSYFEEGTTFDINFQIEADLQSFCFDYRYLNNKEGLVILNKGDTKTCDTAYSYSCKFSISLAEDSDYFCQKDGNIYDSYGHQMTYDIENVIVRSDLRDKYYKESSTNLASAVGLSQKKLINSDIVFGFKKFGELF